MQMKYISTLLYENDCVIIPGLGGFVSNYEPARIEGDRNRFMPPSRKILFNTRLTSNDGLLANHIAEVEGISYSKAMEIIRKFVDRCNRELENNKKVRFPGIGMLYKDANDKILFDQDNEVNYLPEAYGLSQFISPAIYREGTYERLESTMKKSPVISLRRKKVFRGLKWAAIVIPIAAIATWSFLNFDQLQNKYEQYAIYFQPLHKQVDDNKKINTDIEDQYEEARKFAKENAGNTINTSSILSSNNKSENPDKETLPKTSSSKRAEEVTKATPEKENKQAKTNKSPAPEENKTNQPATNQSSFQYHIITGSFIDRSNALEHLNNLKSIGFPARLAGKSNSGYFRVSAFSSSAKNQALKKLSIIREEDYNNAWLLRKRS